MFRDAYIGIKSSKEKKKVKLMVTSWWGGEGLGFRDAGNALSPDLCNGYMGVCFVTLC